MTDQQRLYQFNNLALSTLAAATALTSATKIDTARLQGCRIKEIQGEFTWDGKTLDDGPIYYGFAHGDMDVTKIAAAFAADPQSQDDTDGSKEVLGKMIVVGTIPRQTTSSDVTPQPNSSMWRRIKWPSSWVIREGQNFNMFTFNRGGGALADGTIVRFNGIFITEWRQD